MIRDQRQLEIFQPAPAPAKQIDKSSVLQDQRALSPIAPSQPTPSSGGTGPLPVVGGAAEPDFQFPWVVRMGGCAGVLVDLQWVLTAAHCVTPGIGFGKVTYVRTDPYTRAVSTETRGPISEQRPNPGVYIHPQYAPSMDQANDIALIKLERPFTISPYIQTVGVPRDFRHAGLLGTLASIDHVRMLPPGQAATFRAPIPSDTYAPKFHIPASTTTTLASLCPGDSGSGFVTVENGRATVRGIASQGSISSTECKMPSGEATFTDVFAFRGWILQTMGKPDPFNSRVRWSGRTARGTMGLGCVNTYNMTLWGPLNVVGVEEGIACEANQTQTAICNLDSNQGNVGTMVPTLSGITVRTTTSTGTDVKTIPASGRSASFFGLLPPGLLVSSHARLQLPSRERSLD